VPQRAIDALFVSFQQALVGRYSLERELGRGGMGIVYLAHEVRRDRPVAIKLLPPEFAANAGLRGRFLHEARTAAQLSHPYIVQTYAVEEIDGFVFFVMAFVDGETLAERVRAHGPLKPPDATRVLRDVAWALAYAHAQGVVHRDVKPANVLLEHGGDRALVMDFGIARVTNVTGFTAVGELLGTPEYMSPEQACGEAVDGRSDLYSLGVVGYFALSGTLPFNGSVQKVLAQQVTKAAPPVASVARGTPRALAAAIDKCLAKDPAERFATGEALADSLVSSLESRSELPAPLRVFLDRSRMVQLIVPPLVGLATLGILATLERDGVTHPARIAAVSLLAAILILGPIAVFFSRLRQLLRRGFVPEDIAEALHSLHERRHEELMYEHGQTRHSAGSRFARFWRGSAGHALGRFAGYKLGQRAVPADRHTELGIAMSAEALYAGLPKEVRKSFGDVLTVLHGLEAHARAVRARIVHVDASLQDAQLTPTSTSLATAMVQEQHVADLRAGRGKAEQRLGEIVTSLETLRLDLLRFSAGAGSADSITQNLASARALGHELDLQMTGESVTGKGERGH